MGSFVRDKNEKVKQVFQILGSDHTEEDFINTFKRLYPEDWQKIQDLWSYCHRQDSFYGHKNLKWRKRLFYAILIA